MRWIAQFSLICAVGLGIVISGVWTFEGFATFGLHSAAAIALILGVMFSCAMGVFLMALMFHSRRSGQDEKVHRVHRVEGSDRH
jgi:multisubunit Na+/H+ antiporter MnhB subunit